MFASNGSIEHYLSPGVSLLEEKMIDFSSVAVSTASSVKTMERDRMSKVSIHASERERVDRTSSV